MQVSNLATTEFRATLGALGLAQHRVARLFGVGPRSVRRWRDGDRHVPAGVAIVFRLLAIRAVTVEEVELAAAAISGRTNNSAKGEPPAPLRTEPTLKQSASARAKIATLAGPGLTTAEKLCALAAGACRWPLGDPQQPDFRFCGGAAIKQPYCEHHRALAYLAPRPSRGHGFRIGFVAHGRLPAPVHDRPSTPGAFSAAGAARAPKVLFDRAGDLPGSAPPPA
jgi:hypothetical protein